MTKFAQRAIVRDRHPFVLYRAIAVATEDLAVTTPIDRYAHDSYVEGDNGLLARISSLKERFFDPVKLVKWTIRRPVKYSTPYTLALYLLLVACATLLSATRIFPQVYCVHLSYPSGQKNPVEFDPVLTCLSAATAGATFLGLARIACRWPQARRVPWKTRIRGFLLQRLAYFLAALSIVAAVTFGYLRLSAWDCNIFDTEVWFIGVSIFISGVAVAACAYSTGAPYVFYSFVAAADFIIALVSLLPPSPNWFLANAFFIHGSIVIVGITWVVRVSRSSNASAVDRAKAGEAVRGACTVWVLIVAAAAIGLLFRHGELLDSLFGKYLPATSAALTISALAVTMGSGRTKYAEAVASAFGAVPSQNNPKRKFTERRMRSVSHRMLAACPHLPATELSKGYERYAKDWIRSKAFLSFLQASPEFETIEINGKEFWRTAGDASLLTRQNNLWPTDLILQDLAYDQNRDWVRTSEMLQLIEEAGYQGAGDTRSLLYSHPLIRRKRRFPRKRWSVLI